MSTKAAEIIKAKERAGSDAFLGTFAGGDVILWLSKEDSENDDGANAVGRWTVSESVVDELDQVGAVDLAN